MFHGKIMCKYLKSDMWVFNKIVCLSVEELGMFTSSRGGPSVTQKPKSSQEKCPLAAWPPLLSAPQLALTLPEASSPASPLVPGWLSAGSSIYSFHRYFLEC